MNKINTLSLGKLLILFLAISLSSCSTDGDEREEEATSNDRNYIEVGDTSYELSKAFIHFNDDPEETEGADLYYHDIIIASSGISIDQENEDFTGSENAHFVDFTITSTSSNSIPTGTYTVSTWSDGEDFKMVWSTFESTTFENTSLASGIDMEGTVTIKQEGNEISLQFDGLTGENGEEITGSYTGEFEQFSFGR